MKKSHNLMTFNVKLSTTTFQSLRENNKLAKVTLLDNSV